MGKFQFVGSLDQDGEHVWGFQGRTPGNCGTEIIPYYVFQYGDYIVDPYDSTEMPVPDNIVGRTDCSGTRGDIRGHYISTHRDWNALAGHDDELNDIFGW